MYKAIPSKQAQYLKAYLGLNTVQSKLSAAIGALHNLNQGASERDSASRRSLINGLHAECEVVEDRVKAHPLTAFLADLQAKGAV